MLEHQRKPLGGVNEMKVVLIRTQNNQLKVLPFSSKERLEVGVFFAEVLTLQI